jgi:hypothetical protein
MGEELQDYIAANSGLGYVVGGSTGNFTLEQVLDLDDITRLLGQKVLLTLFDSGGTLTASGSQTHQTREWRFVTKGNHANEATDRARGILTWLWNLKTFETATYRFWFTRVIRMPSILARGESGSHLAEVSFQSLVFNRV